MTPGSVDRFSQDNRQIDPKAQTIAMIKNGARDMTVQAPGPAETHGQRAITPSPGAPKLEVTQGGLHP
jgi:hypothetical protein